MLDVWFEQEVKPRLRGHAFLIRYADDFVIGFRDDAMPARVMEVLPKRFGKYGLTIHPNKTQLVPFRPPSVTDERNGGPTNSGHVRPAGLYPLLGEISERLLGRQAEDGLGSLHPGRAAHRSVVPRQSTPADQ